jgi:hypothetical protein
MRFRPLCIDYHAEATQLLREGRDVGTYKRPVIFLSRPMQTGVGSDNSDDDADDNNNARISNERNGTTMDSPRRHRRRTKRRRHGEPWLIDDRTEDETFTALFQPPRAYTRWIEDWSVSSKTGLDYLDDSGLDA